MPSESPVFLSHIAAAAANNALGLKGKLPWHIPEDLRFFHKTTRGKAVIMGRKTFNSLSNTPLPDRLNAVLTRDRKAALSMAKKDHYDPFSFTSQGVPLDEEGFVNKALRLVFFSSLKAAISFCSQKKITELYGNEIFITGGGEIYKETLHITQKIYLTRIHKDFPGDAFYPEIPQKDFKEAQRKDSSLGPLDFSFITYERKAALAAAAAASWTKFKNS